MHAYHEEMYLKLNQSLKYFRIPTILLSALNVFASVGLQPYIEQGYISLITCGVSLVTGVINSLELYLNINKRMENELDISKEFYLLSIDIYKTLSLQRENRQWDARSYLEEKYHSYCDIIMRSQITGKPIADSLCLISLSSPPAPAPAPLPSPPPSPSPPPAFLEEDEEVGKDSIPPESTFEYSYSCPHTFHAHDLPQNQQTTIPCSSSSSSSSRP
jgi:hypothetical protein